MAIIIKDELSTFYSKLTSKFENYIGKDLFWGTTKYSLEINKEKKHILIYSKRFFSTTIFLKGIISDDNNINKITILSPTIRLLTTFLIFFLFTGILSIYQHDFKYTAQAIIFIMICTYKIHIFKNVLKTLATIITEIE